MKLVRYLSNLQRGAQPLQAVQLVHQTGQEKPSTDGVLMFRPQSPAAVVVSINNAWVELTSGSADLSVIEANILALQGNVTTLQGNVTTLQGNVTTLQGNVTTLQGKVSTLQGNVTTLQGNVTTLQGDVATLTTRTTTLEQDASELRTLIFQEGLDREDADMSILAQIVDIEMRIAT
jgi:chromosome segregation ATPase